MQINQALQKLRAYARDMEESLDQERLRLEEVVKMEIKARIQSYEMLRQESTKQTAGLQESMHDQSKLFAKELEVLKEELHTKVMKEMRDEFEERIGRVDKSVEDVGAKVAMEEKGRKEYMLRNDVMVNKSVEDVGAKVAMEEKGRKEADDKLQKWFTDNAAEAKVAEEMLRAELDATNLAVEAQKKILEEEIVEKVGALRTDVTKLRSTVKADRRDQDALAELVQVHTEVFVDVQRKLDSLFQKTKTQEVQLKNMLEETEEKLEELNRVDEANKKEASKQMTRTYIINMEEETEEKLEELNRVDESNKKEASKMALDAAKLLLVTTISEAAAHAAEELTRSEEQTTKYVQGEVENLAHATKDMMDELSDKMAHNQTILEDLITQTQEDTENELQLLSEKISDQEALLNNEVARLEEAVERKTSELQAEVGIHA
eukprot:gene25239-10885_t